jgi:hypothetical protein
MAEMDDNRHRRIDGAQILDYLQPALSGHAQIDQDQVGAAVAGELQRLFAIACRFGLPVSLRQRAA